MKSILVTGAAGFIGSHLCRALRAAGHVVHGVDSFVSQVHGERRSAEGVYTSTVDNASLQWRKDPMMWADVDTVVHLAAEVGVGQSQYEPARYCRTNTLETAMLWEAIMAHREQIGRVVVASSMSCYGEGEYVHGRERVGMVNGGARLVRDVARGWDRFAWAWADGKRQPIQDALEPRLTREHKVPEPASVYALSKLDTEQYSLLLGGVYDIPTAALRFFNCYGNGQSISNPYTGVLMQFACRAMNGQAPLVYEDGRQLRDFIHVDDIVRGIIAAIETPTLTGAVNVCTGVGTSVGELAERWIALAREAGIDAPAPEITGQYRKGDVRACIGDPGMLTRATGWGAQVSLEQGLARTFVELSVGVTATDHSAAAAAELRQHGLLVDPRDAA